MTNFLRTSGTLFFVLSACSNMPAVPFPETPSMPVEWGQYDVKHLSGSQCPNLQGKYSLPEIKIEVEGKIERKDKAEFSDYFGLFPWFLAEKQIGNISTNDSEEFLRFEQPSGNSIAIELRLSGDRNSHYYRFEESEGDFVCEDGVLRFPARQSFGGIEGSTLNGQLRVGIRKTNDGALIVLRTSGVYRSRDVSDPSSFIHEFYRFDSYLSELGIPSH